MDAFVEPPPEFEPEPSERPVGPDLTVRVTGEAAGVIAAQLAAGRHLDAEAVVAEALAVLQDDIDAQPWGEEAFEEMIAASVDDLEASRYETIAFEVIDRWLEGVAKEARRH